MGGTVVSPENPGRGSGFGAGKNCAGMERLHCKAMVKAECIAGRRGQMVHGCAWG